MINNNILSIWNNKYVCKLSILDHCNEIIQINNEIIRKKNSIEEPDVNLLNDHFNKECADLFLILAAYLNCNSVQETEKLMAISDIVLERQNKFLEKSKE